MLPLFSLHLHHEHEVGKLTLKRLLLFAKETIDQEEEISQRSKTNFMTRNKPMTKEIIRFVTTQNTEKIRQN